MLKKLLTGAAIAASLTAFAGSAFADQYTTVIEHKNADGTIDGNYGLVTIDEIDAFNLQVTVEINPPLELFVDTGKAHIAFGFNLTDTPNSTVSIIEPVGGGSYSYLGEGNFTQSPFGTFRNGFSCCGQGSSNGEPPPLVFKITNLSGITFAGLNAVFDGNNKLVTTGTGNRMSSNEGGWWFAADVSDGTLTGALAARDAFRVTAVPEPATWGLMIMGFGAAGAMIRRRKLAVA